MRRRLIRLWLAVIATVLVPTGAAAQDTLSRWPGLDVTQLSTVYVVDDAGVETTGKLLRIDPDAVVLLVGGAERRVEAPHVRRIDKRGDSLKNGAWIGAVIGAAFGALGAGLSDCSRRRFGRRMCRRARGAVSHFHRHLRCVRDGH